MKGKIILITGGAGYLGSVTARSFTKKGFIPVLFDRIPLEQWNPALTRMICVHGDLCDKTSIDAVFSRYKPHGVIHFAASTSVSESMIVPDYYYRNNVIGGLYLLEAMVQHNCRYVVFSSSSSVYGDAKELINEETKQQPVSVYGTTKKNFEEALRFYKETKNTNHVILRYFNVAGGSIDGLCGENQNADDKLIPSLLRVYFKKQKELIIYGNNYPTRDGTAIRDYIHVEDIASAHKKALRYMFTTGKSDAFNLGSGKGYTNLEVVRCLEKITSTKIPIRFTDPRPGEVAMLVTDNTKAKKILHWRPKYSDLRTILTTSLQWYAKRYKSS